MKVDEVEPTAPKAEGTTPAAEAPTTSKPTRKREPTSEKLSNLSRVTPSQLAHISFPPDSRFQPVRAVSVAVINLSQATPLGKKGTGPQRYASGGGILMLIDKTPGEAIEWIAPKHVIGEDGEEMPTATGTADLLSIGPGEAQPPPAFEYPFDSDASEE